jgi:hypothetical protein
MILFAFATSVAGERNPEHPTAAGAGEQSFSVKVGDLER